MRPHSNGLAILAGVALTYGALTGRWWMLGLAVITEAFSLYLLRGERQ